MFKKTALIVSIIYSASLIFASLVKPENIPKIEINYSDKIFHFLAYGMLTLLWFSAFFYNFRIIEKKAITYSAIFSIMCGLIIEVLQDKLTVYRSLDVYDIVANTLGVIFGVLVVVIKKHDDVKKI